MITYPSGIFTNEDKLHQCYILMEKFRLAHNQYGEKAKTNWEKYRKKWWSFHGEFRDLRSPVMAEILALRDAIRKANYTAQAWSNLLKKRNKATVDALAALFGDPEDWKAVSSTVAIDTLDKLSKIDLDVLAELADPYENWTIVYTEVDTGGYLTVAANHITVTALPRAGPDSRVYKSFGAGHFGAIFVHDIDTIVDSWNDAWAATLNFHCLANINFPIDATDPHIQLFALGKDAAPSHVYGIYIKDGAVDDSQISGGEADGAMRCLTLDRNAIDLHLDLYSDAARTILLGTLTVNKGASSFQYVVSCGGSDEAGGGDITGDAYNLDLHEAAPPAVGSMGSSLSSKMVALGAI